MAHLFLVIPEQKARLRCNLLILVIVSTLGDRCGRMLLYRGLITLLVVR